MYVSARREDRPDELLTRRWNGDGLANPSWVHGARKARQTAARKEKRDGAANGRGADSAAVRAAENPERDTCSRFDVVTYQTDVPELVPSKDPALLVNVPVWRNTADSMKEGGLFLAVLSLIEAKAVRDAFAGPSRHIMDPWTELPPALSLFQHLVSSREDIPFVAEPRPWSHPSLKRASQVHGTRIAEGVPEQAPGGLSDYTWLVAFRKKEKKK